MDTFSFDDLILHENSKEKDYESRKFEQKTEDWGQRKLLLSEIEFFSLYCPNEKIICLYIGAAPGDHIEFLSKMFLNIEFHLYDKNDNYDFNVKESDRIKIYDQYFTDDDIQYYLPIKEGTRTLSKKESRNSQQLPIFLISDLRTVDFITLRKEFYGKNNIEIDDRFIPKEPELAKKYEPMLDLQLENEIWADMERQQKWVKAINPQQALLKFRLPYPNKGFVYRPTGSGSGTGPQKDEVEYLDGTIYFQVWEGATSTELRLVPQKDENGNFKMRKYDLNVVDKQIFYHNTETRLKKKYYNILNNKETTINGDELLNDYDSTAEAAILIIYLKKIDTFQKSSDLEKNVILMSEKITQFLSLDKNRKNRTLSSLRPTKGGLSKLIKPGLNIKTVVDLSENKSEPAEVLQKKKGGLTIKKIGFSDSPTGEPVNDFLSGTASSNEKSIDSQVIEKKKGGLTIKKIGFSDEPVSESPAAIAPVETSEGVVESEVKKKFAPPPIKKKIVIPKK
jgi:hypothetical protein